MISGFHIDVDQFCALLGHYTASSDNSVPTFPDNLSVASSRVKNPRMGPIGCPEASLRKYHSMLCNVPEERRSQSAVFFSPGI